VQFDEIQQIFFLECEEGLAAAEGGLLAFQNGQQDGETINTIFRAVHSIKGGAGAFGFNALQAFTHKFETVLDLAREGTLPLTPALVSVLLRAFDMLSDHIAAIRGEGHTPDDGAVLAQLESTAKGGVAVAGSGCDSQAADPQQNSVPGLDFSFDDLMSTLNEAEATPVADESGTWTLKVRPEKGALANGGEPMLLIRELMALGVQFVETDISAIPTLDSFDLDGAYLAWTFAVPQRVSESDVREIFDFVLDSCDLETTHPDQPREAPRCVAPVAIPTPQPVAAAKSDPFPPARAIPAQADPAPAAAALAAPASAQAMPAGRRFASTSRSWIGS